MIDGAKVDRLRYNAQQSEQALIEPDSCQIKIPL